jgi:hypothetical protein
MRANLLALRIKQRILLAAWLVWACTIFGIYYRQMWSALSLPLRSWIQGQYSLDKVYKGLWQLVYMPEALVLPYWREALNRSLLGILAAAAVLLSAQALGKLTLKLLRINLGDIIDRMLYRGAIGVGALALLSLGLAGLGLYTPITLKTLVIALAVLGSLNLVKEYRAGCLEPANFNPNRSVEKRATGTPDRLWGALAVLFMVVTFVAALAPEIEYDALWYHLWLPKIWLEHGRAVDIVSEYVSLYPLQWEMAYGASLALVGPTAAKLLHFACLPLTSLAIYQIMKRYFPSVPAGLAILLFVSTPSVLWESATAYIDLALAFLATLVVYALLRYLESHSKEWLILASISMGLALATKHLALLIYVGCICGLLVGLWLQERRVKPVLQPLLLFTILSLILPLPWYARAWTASGNPFFPDLFKLFGAFPPERWNATTERLLAGFKESFGYPRTLANTLLLPWNMTLHAARFGGSLGPIYLITIPVFFFERRSRASLFSLALILIYLGLWATPISSFQMRFVIPITPILAILSAQAVSTLYQWVANGNFTARLFTLGLAGLVLLNLPIFTSLHEGERVQFQGWLTHVLHEIPLGVVAGGESQESYLARRLPSYRAWQFINANLPKNARVLTFSGGDHFYSERERLWSDSAAARPATWGAPRGQALQAIAALEQLGVTHVLFDKQMIDSPERVFPALTDSEVISDHFVVEYEDHRYLIGRLIGSSR